MSGIEPLIRGMCPNCGGTIEASRLEKGLPCSSCLAEDTYTSVEEVGKALASSGKLLNYAWVYDLEEEFKDFEDYFYRKTGSSLWSAQASWAKRLLMLESIAIIAPTGVGKTTLVSVYSAYRVEREGWRVLYLVPTQNLVKQIASNLSRIAPGVIYYTGSMSKTKRQEVLEKVEKGEFNILVVTTSFLQRRFDLLLKNAPFQLVIVDDVDSLLRSGANVERVLRLMGFEERTIELAERLVKERFKLYAALAQGKEDRVRELQTEVARLETELALGQDPPMSQLIVASATGRPRGIKHYLFKELLGFEVGGGSDYMRDVTDAYSIDGNIIDRTVKIVKRLGPGTIVFVSQLLGKAAAKLLTRKLQEQGVRALVALAGSRRAISYLAEGKADVIVGVASRYGVIVRGIDLPEIVKHAVFVEIPARRQRLEDALASPRRQLQMLLYLKDKGVEKAGELFSKLSKLLEKISDPKIVVWAYQGKIEKSGVISEIVDTMKEGSELILREMERIVTTSGGVVRIGGTVVEFHDGSLHLVLPDAPTYLQASGRTSRLFKGVMTHGLSVVVTGRREYIEALEERLSWYTSGKFQNFDELDFNSVLAKIDETRRGVGKKINVKTVLLIVESPTKARTIAWFWGRPSKRRFGRLTVYETSTVDPETGTVYLLTITASRGHILELAIDEEDSIHGVRVEGGLYKPVYTSIKRCLSCGYTFAGDGPCPRCGSTSVFNSASIIEALRKLALEVDEIVIASDPDREGEKIAWDLYLVLRPYNPNVKRGRFHEVTRRAVLEALRNAGGIDKRLVHAQIVRRIQDRWIGFSLSRHLWALYGKRWLGAGRVQTPVLGWAVNRFKEWKDNRGYQLVLKHEETGEKVYLFDYDKNGLKNLGESVEALVEEYEEWWEDTPPPPPYTTDELIYDASRRFGYTAGFTMKLAQELFESGLITYHRTDSTRVSSAGIAIAKEYLEKKGLTSHFHPRSWASCGAHEAIRPTRPLDVEEVQRAVVEGTLKIQIKLTRAHFKLYDLIFRRFMASQMKPSRIRRSRALLRIGSYKVSIEAAVGFEKHGFALISPPRISQLLASIRKGDVIRLVKHKLYRSSSVRLYKVGDLVKIMKQKGLGRPSTYAKAIEANRRHGYLIISKRAGYAVPTKLGITVYNYLLEHFEHLVSEETSKRMEEVLDSIERGEMSPVEALEATERLVGEILVTAGVGEGVVTS